MSAPSKVPQTVGEFMASKRAQIERALPRHLSVDRLLRICMTELMKNPELKECTQASLFGAILQAAQLGLEPGSHLGHCYLVPFFNKERERREVQLIVGYKGYIDLARRSGRVTVINARAAYEMDKFEFHYGLNDHLQHVPARGDSGKLIAVYAVARFNNGLGQFEVMYPEEVEEIRQAYSRAKSGPWFTEFDEMAKKTVLRRLCKYLPLSPELHAAVALDEKAERGLEQDNASLIEGAIDGTDAGSPPVARPSMLDQLNGQFGADAALASTQDPPADAPVLKNQAERPMVNKDQVGGQIMLAAKKLKLDQTALNRRVGKRFKGRGLIQLTLAEMETFLLELRGDLDKLPRQVGA